MCHHWAYTAESLMALLQKHGFEHCHEELPRFHEPRRDMRIVGIKGC
jgi:hypothetical protein